MKNDYWYKRADVKFEIIRFTQNREFAIMIDPVFDKKMVRLLICKNVGHLDWLLWNFLRMDEKDTKINLYYSMAVFMKIPRLGQDMPFDLKERRGFIEAWNKTAYKEMFAYDMLIDIDSPNHDNIDFAHYSAKSIKDFFDAQYVPYELRFSGCGFHFVIPYEFFIELKRPLNPYEEKNIYLLYAKIGRYLSETFSELVDYSIYDSRRVCKIPYTISSYQSSDYVCLPFLDNKSFINFELKDMKPCNNTNVRGRGTRLFNSQTKKWNAGALLKKMGIDSNEYRSETARRGQEKSNE